MIWLVLSMIAVVAISVATAAIYDKIANPPCKWHKWKHDEVLNRYRCETCNMVCF